MALSFALISCLAGGMIACKKHFAGGARITSFDDRSSSIDDAAEGIKAPAVDMSAALETTLLC